MRRRYALRIRRRMRTVVEVHLRAGLIDCRRQHLLRILALVGAHANHPHQQHNEDDEDHAGRNAAGNVREFGALRTDRTRKRAGASARRCALQILDAQAAVVAVVGAHVRAMRAGAVEARLAFALEIGRLRHQNAVGVRIAVRRGRTVARRRGGCLARIRALGPAGGRRRFRTVIGRASDAAGLLRLRLVEALAAFDASVQRAVEIGAG